MNYRLRRVTFVSAALLLVATVVSPQQACVVVLTASGTGNTTLQVKAFEKDRHFIIQASGDAVPDGSSTFSLGIEVVADDAKVDPTVKSFSAHGCTVKNTASLDKQSGRLHAETSCEIVVAAGRLVTVKANTGNKKFENITLKAISW